MVLSDFLSRLSGVKKSGQGWIARCPAHEDKNPSLSISSNGTGKILVKCHSGCSVELITGAMGLDTRDLFSGNEAETRTGKENRPVVAVHEYRDADGRLLFQKARFATKPKTKPRHKGPDGHWRWGAGTPRRPLYRLPEILKVREVVVCEGEKDCDNLWDLGFQTTSTPFGRWEPEHIEALKGKDILIVGDNDSAGEEKVRKAVEALMGHAKSIRIIELPADGKPEGWDVSDFIAEFDEPGAAAEKLAILMEQAPEFKHKKPNQETFPPLSPKQTTIRGVLIQEPPDPDPILTYNESPVLTRGVVGGLMASGGIGKTMLMLQFAHVMADGGSLGPLRAADDFKVLMLCAEDPQEEINRRLWRLGRGDFPAGLHVASTMGQVGPLMQLKEGNPQRAQAFEWLRDTIKNHSPLDLLILDPKSRFYGLDENNNDHATQWIACLESLSNEFNLTILFTHHVSKARADSMGQAMSRGASAIVDGCRWVAGMTRLNEESAKRYGITDPRGYIEFDITKSNYAAQLPSKFVFKRTENGLLEYAALEVERRTRVKKILYEGIMGSDDSFSRRDFVKKLNGSGSIVESIEAAIPSFQRTREIIGFIDELISDYLLEEIPGRNIGQGTPKTILKAIPFDPMNFRQKRL